MPFECSGCSAGHISNATILLKEYEKFREKGDGEQALLHLNEAIGNIRQAEEQAPDKKMSTEIRNIRKSIETKLLGDETPNLSDVVKVVQRMGVEGLKFLAENPQLCPTCNLDDDDEEEEEAEEVGEQIDRVEILKREGGCVGKGCEYVG